MATKKVEDKVEKKVEAGKVSDGNHTFEELYEHRNALFAVVLHDHLALSWKTWRNDKGEVNEGWFIAGLNTEFGQISYHYPAEWWEKLPDVPEIERNLFYDGHTSDDVAKRLFLFSRSQA